MTHLLWLSDDAWAAIEPHLPRGKPGKPRVDDRRQTDLRNRPDLEQLGIGSRLGGIAEDRDHFARARKHDKGYYFKSLPGTEEFASELSALAYWP